MTDKEKKALREAFDFPEPDRKEEFLAQFAELSENRNKKRMFPVIMRFAASAAMLAAVIGVLTLMPKDKTDFRHDIDEITAVTETAPVPSASAATTAVTTSKAVITDKTTSAKTTGTAVTKISTTAAMTVTAQRTEASSKTTAVRTADVHTTVRTTSSAAENSVTQKPVTTTAAPKPEDTVITHDDNKGSGRDMTAAPDIIYPVRSKTVTEGEITAKDDAVDSHAPGQSKPVDKQSVLESLYNDSSAVVLANVDEMLYTSINGSAVTAENISIVSSYKGELAENDRITVFFSGGYIPAEIYLENHADASLYSPEEYSVYEKGMSRFPQEKGRQYIFFIKKDDESIKEGAYSPVRSGNTAVFKKVYGNYVSVDDANIFFSAAQLDELG